MTNTVRNYLEDLYRRVDAAVAEAGPRCDASGRCCRFEEYGHTLFISGIEAEYLIESAPSYSQPVTRAFCPFQINNLCTAREVRPLGCRIYFCDPNYQETGNQLTESSLTDLKQLTDRENLDWRYAPLHVFLNEAEAREVPAISPTTRITLPLA
jgi:Fe-S-cluster containining protein